MSGKIFIISAASGAGKTSLVNAIVQELPNTKIEKVITYTTRKPRNNEQEGRDYYFIDIIEFEKRIQEGFFLEWSNAYGAYYGSPRSIIKAREQGYAFILILDRAGAQRVIEQVPDAILIWVATPSIACLKDRLMQRATEDGVAIEKRLKQSATEIALEQAVPLYRYTVINDRFEQAKQKLVSVIINELGLKQECAIREKEASN